MYAPLQSLVATLLRVPTSAPETPAGSHASVRVFRASPRYLTYRLLGLYIGGGFAFVVLTSVFVITLVSGVWPATAGVALVAAIVFALLFVSWFAVRIEYDLRYYIVTDRSLRVREGAWIVKEMTLTYANVQHLRIEQGPLQRMFGIADLCVDTAGGGSGTKHEARSSRGHQVRIEGIEDARAVRDLVLGYARAQHVGSGLGDLDDPESRARSPWTSVEVASALRSIHEASLALRRAAELRGGPSAG